MSGNAEMLVNRRVLLLACLLTVWRGEAAKALSRRENSALPEFSGDRAWKVDPRSGTWLVSPFAGPPGGGADAGGLLQRDYASQSSHSRSHDGSHLPFMHSHMDDFRVDEQADPSAEDIINDGLVRVARSAQTDGDVQRFKAKGQECLVTNSLSYCWEKYGSYAFPHLLSESWDSIKFLHAERPTWMGNSRVQQQRLYNLTLPGTRHSGAFMVDSNSGVQDGPAADEAATGNPRLGVITQQLAIYDQLRAGIRALDVRVAWNTHQSSLFASNGAFTVPLTWVLRDLRRFLDTNPHEIVVLSMGKDMKTAQAAGNRYLKPILNEESSSTKVPGEMVHMVVANELGAILATHKNLQRLPTDEVWENPAVHNLVSAGVRVMYFWEGQQVLCTSLDECQATPGWQSSDGPFTFGEPMLPGQRAGNSAAVQNGQPETRVVEPACLYTPAAGNPSRGSTAASTWTELVAGTLRVQALHDRPPCFPQGVTDATLPELSQPTLLYNVHATTDIAASEKESQLQLTSHGKAIFSRGEAYTVRSEAERLNYLLLHGLFRQGAQSLYGQPNVISLDFPAPVLIHRIIEVNQQRKECGIAVYCRASGGCWAQSLQEPDLETEDDHADECNSNYWVERSLWWRAQALYSPLAYTLLNYIIYTIAFFYAFGIIALNKCFCHQLYPKHVRRPRRMTLNDYCCPCYFWCFDELDESGSLSGSGGEDTRSVPSAVVGHPVSAPAEEPMPDNSPHEPEVDVVPPTVPPKPPANLHALLADDQVAAVHDAEVALAPAPGRRSQHASAGRRFSQGEPEIMPDVDLRGAPSEQSQRAAPARAFTREGPEIHGVVDMAPAPRGAGHQAAASRQVEEQGVVEPEVEMLAAPKVGSDRSNPKAKAALRSTPLVARQSEPPLAQPSEQGAQEGDRGSLTSEDKLSF